MKLIVTGASGFIGRALVHEAMRYGDELLAVTRKGDFFNGVIPEMTLEEMLGNTTICQGYDAIIHSVGLAHGKRSDTSLTEEEEMWAVNTNITHRVAELAFKHSSARFVFLSSLAVYGKDGSNFAITEESALTPKTTYGKSKREAERAISVLASVYDREYTIVRPPLVYGINAPANFGLLTKLARTPLPLPFASARAQRSSIGVRNLAAFLRLVATHPQARNEKYVIADHGPNSLRDLIIALRGGNAGMIPVSPKLIQAILDLIGREKLGKQLFSPLPVDWSKAERSLSWEPEYSFDENMEHLNNI